MAIPVLNNLDLNGNQLLNALLQLLASDPGSPANGRVWVDTVSHVLKARMNGVTVTLGRLDQISPPTAPVSMNSQRLSNLADASAGTDAVTKQQLDAVVSGIDWKENVRAATTANITLSGAQTIDGVAVVAGDRVLVRAQTTGADNGIYLAASGAWARASDADSTAEVNPGMSTIATEGTTNGDGWFVLTTNGPITLGTTSLAFTKLAPATATGVTKFAATIGDGSATSYAVTHNLGTTDIVVNVTQVSDGAQVIVDAVRTNSNTVTIVFATAPATNTFRVTVMG